jgi:hypothetical protein
MTRKVDSEIRKVGVLLSVPRYLLTAAEISRISMRYDKGLFTFFIFILRMPSYPFYKCLYALSVPVLYTLQVAVAFVLSFSE